MLFQIHKNAKRQNQCIYNTNIYIQLPSLKRKRGHQSMISSMDDITMLQLNVRNGNVCLSAVTDQMWQ